LNSLLEIAKTFDQILAILDFSILEKQEVPEDILKIFEQRNTFKKNKDFQKADEIRDILIEK
jgi:hypothetical protein